MATKAANARGNIRGMVLLVCLEKGGVVFLQGIAHSRLLIVFRVVAHLSKDLNIGDGINSIHAGSC
jgi:hypothetical protein